MIDSDVALCGITMGFLAAPLSTLFGGGGGMGFAVGALIGTTVSMIGVAVAGDLYEPDSGIFLNEDMELDCELVTSDDDHAEVRCVTALNLGSNPLIGPLTADRHLRVRTETPMEGGISLKTIMGHLTIRGGEGTRLAFFDITRQHEVLVGPVLDIPLDAHLVGAPSDRTSRLQVPQNGRQRVTMANGRGLVPRRSSSSAWPQLRVEPSSWLDTAVRFGNRLAQLEDDGQQMAIYRIADTFAG